MKKISSLFFASVLLSPLAASAQDYYAQTEYQPPQLEQMVAPIALYPDSLLTPVLVASGYPQQISDALNWLGNPSLAQMSPDQVSMQLQQMPWDDSVKFLTAFPQVLQQMNDNPSWTQQMGSAYAQQPYDVMDAVQDLRHDAEEDGALRSNSQQSVYQQGNDILIQPANPDMIYVPSYNPALVYGEWINPAYPPYAFIALNHRDNYFLPPALTFGFVRSHWQPHPMAWETREHADHAFHTSYPAPEVRHDAQHDNGQHFEHDHGQVARPDYHPAPAATPVTRETPPPVAAPQMQQHFEEAPRSPGLAHQQPAQPQPQQAAPMHSAPPPAMEHHEEPTHDEPHQGDGHDEHHP